MKIGERIRNLRQLSNLTQEELAERANLTKGFISQIERDLTSISLDSLAQILDALGKQSSPRPRIRERNQKCSHRVHQGSVPNCREK